MRCRSELAGGVGGTHGSLDTLARLVAQRLSERFGQQVIVDNRPGAGGIVGTEMGVKDVIWRQKSNYSAPCDAAIVEEITNWHAVFAGVGD